MTSEVGKMVQDTFALENDLDRQIKLKAEKLKETEMCNVYQDIALSLDSFNKAKDGFDTEEEKNEYVANMIATLLDIIKRDVSIIESLHDYIEHLQNLCDVTSKGYKAMKTRYFQLAGAIPDNSNTEDDGK